MKSERMEMLEGLLKGGISPILLEDFPAGIFTVTAKVPLSPTSTLPFRKYKPIKLLSVAYADSVIKS